MDAQELLKRDLASITAILNDAAYENNQYELQSERRNPLAFCEGCALALGISVGCWALFFSIIHLLVVLVINGR